MKNRMERVVKVASSTRRGSNRKGIKASDKQKEALAAGRKKADEARRQRKQARSKQVEVPRWKQLENGDIHVRDLSDEECLRGEVANNDGSWEGRRHRLPPRLVSRMEQESIRRARNDLLILTPDAIKAIEERLVDNEAPAQQLAAARLVLEYRIGKVPDVVHVGQETEFDRLTQTGFVILRGEGNVVQGEVLDTDEEEAG